MAPGMMVEGAPGMMGGGYGAGSPGFPFPSLQGTLRFKGPKTEVGGLAISPPGGGGMNFYIDGVYFEIRINSDSTGSFFLDIAAQSFPAESEIPGSPENGLDRAVSSVSSIRLTNWTLTVSKEPVAFPDGSRHLELRAINTDGGEEIALPLVKNAMRKAGRFTIQVRDVWGDTRTAHLRIDAEGDPTIKGRLAWPQDQVQIAAGDTLKDFLDSFGKKYGFAVEWIPFPDHPESIQAMQDAWCVVECHPSSFRTIRDALDSVVRSSVFKPRVGQDTIRFRFEWKHDTHLQVIPVDFDKYLAAQEKEEKKLAAAKKAEEECDAEAPRFTQLFADQYGLQTKIYKLETLTPVTAKALIEKDLWKYFLGQYFLKYQPGSGAYEPMPMGQGSSGVVMDPDFRRIEKGQYHVIGRVNPSTALAINDGFLLLGSVVEEAIADDKANALIVTAIPTTHETIAALLDKMENLASNESPKGPPPAPYRISAVLLQGVQKGGEATPSRGAAGEAFVPSVRANEVGGVVKEIPVKVGEAVSMNDVLIRLDPATLTTSLIDLYTRDLEVLTKRKAESGTSLPDVDKEIEDLKKKIQSQRRDLAMNHENEIRAPRGLMNRYRVSSIPVKEGDPVILGQELVTLEPYSSPLPKGDKSTGAATAASAGPASPTPSLFEQYGLRPAELKSFGIESVSEMGKGIVSLVPEKGDIGVARIALGGDYTLTLTFLDERSPYVVVKGALQKGKDGDVVIENTLYLEADKPTLLGVTNLREALILIVRRFDVGETPVDPAAKSGTDGADRK